MDFSVLLLLLATLLAACQNPGESTSVSLGEEFRIKIGQQVTISGHGLRISFSAVHDESRCPTGVQCIWEGNAGVVVRVSKNRGKVVQATLNTNASVKPGQLEHKGYNIRLVGLNPYPKADERIEPKDYEALLMVTKE